MKKYALLLLAVLVSAVSISPQSRHTSRSPDTAQPLAVAASFQQPSRFGIHIVDLQTGKIRFVADWYDWKLSPDGQYIAGGQQQGRIYSVLVADVVGGDVRHLAQYSTDGDPYHPNLTWSSDSTRITLSGDDLNHDGKNDVFVVPIGRPASGKRSLPVSPPGLRLPRATSAILRKQFDVISDVAFSPDRKWVVAYCAKGVYDQPNYRGGIFVFRVDGSRLTQITKGVSIQRQDGRDVRPTWLPSGKGLVFRRTSYEDEGI
jgi:hypothetical protein